MSALFLVFFISLDSEHTLHFSGGSHCLYVARLFPVQIRISVAGRLVSASASQLSEMQDAVGSHLPKGNDPFLTAKYSWLHLSSSLSTRLLFQDTSYFHFILVCFMYWQNTVLLKVFDKVLLSKLMNEEFIKTLTMGEQDGRGVGRRGVHPSPRIHQEYTFRHRSACRTPAESRQAYLTSGKEYTESCKTR